MMTTALPDPRKSREKPAQIAAEESAQETKAIIQNDDAATTNIDTAVVNADINGVPLIETVEKPAAGETRQPGSLDQGDIAEVEEQQRIVNDDQDDIGIN